MKVLLVDDSRSARALTASYLREMDYPTIEAVDGADALALYRAEAPELVLLDVEMPGENGYAVARKMRALDSPGCWTPIIFLSGRIADEDVAQGIEAGGDDYIAKPVSPVILRAKLLAMRRITEMRRQLFDLTKQLQEANRSLLRLSSQDGLTGIANRRAFDAAMEGEWRRGLRSGKPLALILGDIDYFKRYNDRYGHQAGDGCLKQVAAALAERARRSGDVVARFGGEEFVLLLPETALPGALSVAEDVLDGIRGLGIAHAGSDVEPFVTISLGVGVCVAGADIAPRHLIEAADKALYQAKSAGRNRCAFLPVEELEPQAASAS